MLGKNYLQLWRKSLSLELVLCWCLRLLQALLSLGRSQFCLRYSAEAQALDLHRTNCPLSPDLGLSADAFICFQDLLFSENNSLPWNPHLLPPKSWLSLCLPAGQPRRCRAPDARYLLAIFILETISLCAHGQSSQVHSMRGSLDF